MASIARSMARWLTVGRWILPSGRLVMKAMEPKPRVHY